MKPLKSPFWRETGLGNTLLLLKDSRLEWISTSKSRSCLHEETTHYWSLLHLLAWSKCSFDSTTAPASLDMVPSVIAKISARLLNRHSGWWTYLCQLTCNTDIWNMQFSESLKQYYFDLKKTKHKYKVVQTLVRARRVQKTVGIS